MLRFGLLSFAGVLALSSPLAAEEAPVAPSDPAAKAAFDMLETHCSRCHQSGKLVNRSKPASGFGNILKLDELISSGHVVPGNPEASPIYKVMMPEPSMPDDAVNGSAKFPEPQEIAALHAWIKSLGSAKTSACAERKTVSTKDLVGVLAQDLESLRPDRRTGTRYLTLTNLFAACATNEEMDVYRKAVVKLLNSLSRRSTIVKLETVGAEKAIIRFNISDLGWEASDWDEVLVRYPYGTKPDTTFFSALESATGTKLPFIRADWFAFSASKPPLYDRLVKLPADFKALTKDEGVDLEANIKNFLVQRAGFQNSGVSENNRLIERHDSRSGYFWTSYDFAGNKNEQNLFKNPLGPGGEFGFKHDGGETIFSLPNGFQAYYLNTADGKKLDLAPISIVQDTTKTGDQTVTNGISCMSCHDRGIKAAKDEIRALVTADRNFPEDVRQKVEALYPDNAKLTETLAKDEARFMRAMQEAGLLEPTKPGEPLKPVTLNGEEMINALANRYEQPVTADLAAAEYGLKPQQFSDAAKASGAESLTLVRRLEQQGTVPRDQFEADYLGLAEKINGDTPIQPQNDAVVAALAVKTGEKTDGKPDANSFELELLADKSRYKTGEKAVFTVTSQKDCSLTLVNVDAKGAGTIIFPNSFRKDSAIKAKQKLVLGDAASPFDFVLKDKGTEQVIAVCNASSAKTRGLEPDYKAGGFTDLGNFVEQSTKAAKESAQARQIAVKEKAAAGNGAKADAKSAANVIGRAAIKIEVE